MNKSFGKHPDYSTKKPRFSLFSRPTLLDVIADAFFFPSIWLCSKTIYQWCSEKRESKWGPEYEYEYIPYWARIIVAVFPGGMLTAFILILDGYVQPSSELVQFLNHPSILPWAFGTMFGVCVALMLMHLGCILMDTSGDEYYGSTLKPGELVKDLAMAGFLLLLMGFTDLLCLVTLIDALKLNV